VANSPTGPCSAESRRPNVRVMGNATKTKAPCPTCGSEEILILSMIVAESDLRFTCCVACENRWWEREGRSIPLDSVLEIVSTR
jgi:transcription elongation factor Elf1